MNEVARRHRLARGVAFEVSIDLMLQFAMKSLDHQLLEALQTMRVVGETELTKKGQTELKSGTNTSKQSQALLFIVANAGVRQLRDLC